MVITRDPNLNITTVNGLNRYIEDSKAQEAKDCVEYFKQFLDNPSRSRRREEAYEGWPLVDEKQVRYVLAKLPNVKAKKQGGMWVIHLIRKGA